MADIEGSGIDGRSTIQKRDPEKEWEQLSPTEQRQYEIAADHTGEYVVIRRDTYVFSSRKVAEAVNKLSELNRSSRQENRCTIITPHSPFIQFAIRKRVAEQAVKAAATTDADNGGLPGIA